MSAVKSPLTHWISPVIWALFLVIVIGPLDAALGSEVVFRSSRGLEIGDSLQPRSLTTRDGRESLVPSEEGLTVVLFWATWSPRSKPALEVWEKYSKEYGDQPLTVITINADNQRMDVGDLKKVDKYIEENNVSLPVSIDQNLSLFNEIGVVVNPTTLFFKSDGTLIYKLSSFPSSAPIDLKEELEVRLGLKEKETDEEKATRGTLAYQPKNNALLYYNMAINLLKKGFTDKAIERLIISLQRDPEYADPLRALEGIYFTDDQDSEGEKDLKDLLLENDLEDLVDKVGQGEPFLMDDEKKSDPMEKMRQMMGTQGTPDPDIQKENDKEPSEGQTENQDVEQ
ncbi:redoxin domain-containing protein [bacterium]|nr:MAG: redoxin domain-containing protein [bacterium]